MYEYFIGIIKEIYENKIIFECNNYGYILEGVNLQLFPLNSKVKIYIYFYQKPAYQQYFAFLSKSIKTFFIHLINISSVVHKTALKLLNQLSVETIKIAINKRDYKALQQCKGITQKIANNIINYFHSQLNLISNLDHNSNYSKSNLVFDTLLKLGFSKEVINDFLLTNVNWDLEIEEIITNAIKALNNGYY